MNNHKDDFRDEDGFLKDGVIEQVVKATARSVFDLLPDVYWGQESKNGKHESIGFDELFEEMTHAVGLFSYEIGRLFNECYHNSLENKGGK